MSDVPMHARRRVKVQSMFYGYEMPQKYRRWISGQLPINHFQRNSDVRYKPKGKRDFLSFWQDDGGSHRALPKNMFRHRKMARRLEAVEKDLASTVSASNAVQDEFAAVAANIKGLTADEQKLVAECAALSKDCVAESQVTTTSLRKASQAFGALVTAHSDNVFKMAESKVPQKQSSRNRGKSTAAAD